jgi:hypothetical protein
VDLCALPLELALCASSKGLDHSLSLFLLKKVRLAFGKRFQICSSRLRQSFPDVKAKPHLELYALLPVAFLIANQ